MEKQTDKLFKGYVKNLTEKNKNPVVIIVIQKKNIYRI